MTDYCSKEMHVIKRSGNKEAVAFDKILNRVKILGGDNLKVNYSALVIKVIDQLHDNISTSKIDELTAEQAASLATKHPDYGKLASALVVSNLQKNTTSSFSEAMNALYKYIDDQNNTHLLSDEFINVVNENKDCFDNLVDHNRDYLIDYFGFKTLERAYLMHINKKIIERPQYMWMRVAVSLHLDDLVKVKETYDLISQKYFTHATPTLFNAGTPRPQLSSCFLIAMESDSVDGIYNTLKECANISKWAGGIGLHIHNIRGTGSHIRGTNGTSNGIIPMLGVFNKTARYIDQCVSPETYIYTKNGSIQIQNIKNSDYIYNSKGLIEKIDNILEHPYDGEIYNIETMHSINKLEITPEHPVLVMVDQYKGTNFNIITKRIEAYEKNKNIMDIFENNAENENEIFQWKEAKNLTYDDMPVFVIPTYSEDNNKLSWKDCYMYGIILGDGCLSNKYTNGYISMHTINKREILEFCKSYFDEKYVEYKIQTEGNVTRLRWNKTINLPFRYSDIYDNNQEKHICSEWLNLPIEKAKYIVKGLIDTDGCKNKEVVFDSTSYNLIENMRFLLLKMGIPTSGYKRDRIGEKHTTERGIIENKKISYCLRIPQTKELCELLGIEYTSKFFKFLRYKNLLFTRIKSITKSHYEGTLYDLQLKETHNYMIHNGIIHNGGGKRAGSFAIYIEPHHPDIEEFLDLKKNHGDEELRARDLFYALWISDLFMERVQANAKWSLFCPDQTPGLSDCYGHAYKDLYLEYEEAGRYVKQIEARDLWIKILDSQMETGTPYMLYKDAVNYKSNQKNLGTIKSSNLCVEIAEFSSPDETAVCNLASIGLTKFVKETENPFSNVKVYSKKNCNWCLLLKALLRKRNIDFEEIVLESDEEIKEFKETYNVTTVPQLIDNGELIGGYNTIEEKLRYTFDYEKLHKITKVIANNLNKIIDINYYPTPKTKRSNLNHRPIGIGVQGLADVFILMDTPFDSEEAKVININIFKTIYHAALEKSLELSQDRIADIKYLRDEYKTNWDFADESDICTEYVIFNNTEASSVEAQNTDERIKQALKHIKPIRKEIEYFTHDKSGHKSTAGAYQSFDGSPASKGLLQYDFWKVDPNKDSDLKYDWNKLKTNICKYGIRNSLLVAPMPTASTSQILGNNECFEPITSNIYSRRTLAGEFVVANKYLIEDLLHLDMWNETIKNNIIQNKGSIQYIDIIPQRIKDKYKIVWEIPIKHLINLSKDRGAYICQSQSLNLWVEEPNAKTLTNMHFYSWKQGLKTGIYYLRRKPRHQPQQFTIEPEKKVNLIVSEEEEGCTMCSG
tara:strand:- start:6534 stop:10454 length:3921 start_codon:yes stop_codon:yes gene_type:complete